MSASIREILDGAGLGACAEKIIALGVERAEDLSHLKEDDLTEMELEPIQIRKLWSLVQKRTELSTPRTSQVGIPSQAARPKVERVEKTSAQNQQMKLTVKNTPQPADGAPAVVAVEDDSDDDSKNLESPVATIVLPGTEDCKELMRRGGIEVSWAGKKVTRFKETRMSHEKSDNLLLPTLYLHFLDENFCVKKNEYNEALRAGTDDSEVQLVLPDAPYMSAEYTGVDDDTALKKALRRVVKFLRIQAEVMASPVVRARGSKSNYVTELSAGRMYFALKTARPKSTVSLDKRLFGIPETADIYLFATNHISVSFMNNKDSESFELCIENLFHRGEELKKFSMFLKVFYEGGFAYNDRQETADRSGYWRENVGIAGMGVTPAFTGQSGISTGYPYLLKSRFLPFHDTVPVTIKAVNEISQRHARYGLCFTRCVHVWETDAFEKEDVLNYCCVTPNGGFFYVPSHLRKHLQLGGLVYAFGEARDAHEVPGERM